jgi:putative ABC transport system permease protein
MLIRIAARNVLTNWRHSFAAIVTVSAALASLVLFRAYMADVTRLYDQGFSRRMMLGDLVVEREGAGEATFLDPWQAFLSEEEVAWTDAYLSKHQSELDAVVRFLPIYGSINNGLTEQVFLGLAYDRAQARKMRRRWAWNTLAGRPLEDSDSADVMLTGRILGSQLQCRPASKARYLGKDGLYIPEERPFECASPVLQLSVSTEAGQANAASLEVVGIMDALFADIDRGHIALPLETAQALYDTRRLGYYGVGLTEGVSRAGFVLAMQEAARNAGHKLLVQDWREHRFGDLYRRTMDLLLFFRTLTLGVMLLIGGLSVYIAFLKIIHQRTPEIGILKTLGFSRAQIRGLFVWETVFVSLVGCGIGAAASMLFSWVVRQLGIYYKAGILSEPVLFGLSLNAGILLSSGVFLIMVSLVASLLPLSKANKATITQNLGHV